MENQKLNTTDSATRTTPEAPKDSNNPTMGDTRKVEISCPTHGTSQGEAMFLFSSWTTPKCPACLEAEAKAEAAKLTAQETQRMAGQVEKMREKSCIPARFLGKGFETFEQKTPSSMKTWRKCHTYAVNFPAYRAKGTGLILAGNAGNGKTHLACAIIAEIIERHHRRAQYALASDLFRRVKATFSKTSDIGEDDALRQYTAPDLLVIDEIGVQYGSDTEKNILFEVVNRRYQDMKPTILVTNLAVDALEKFAGERVIDRMRENGGMLAVFDWESRRASA